MDILSFHKALRTAFPKAIVGIASTAAMTALTVSCTLRECGLIH